MGRAGVALGGPLTNCGAPFGPLVVPFPAPLPRDGVNYLVLCNACDVVLGLGAFAGLQVQLVLCAAWSLFCTQLRAWNPRCCAGFPFSILLPVCGRCLACR